MNNNLDSVLAEIDELVAQDVTHREMFAVIAEMLVDRYED